MKILSPVFSNKNYTKLLIGNTISSFGDSMYSIALTVALYKATGNISAVAFMWLIRASMRIPIQFISGIIADSYPRKKLICITNLISAPVALGFLFFDSQNHILIYLLIFFLQAFNDIEQPAIMGLMQEIVDKDQLKEANAISSLIDRIATLASPALAGGLMLVWGVSVLFLINGISFILAAIILYTIDYHSVIEKKKREFTLFRFAKEGYEKAIENKAILLMLCIGILPGIMGRFYEIYKVHVSDKLLQLGSEGIVFFSYSMTIGGILSPLIIKYFFKNFKFTAKFYSFVLVIHSAIMVVWGVVDNPILNLVILTVGGIFFSSVGIILRTYLQENVDAQYIGRIFSLYQMMMILGAIIGILSAPKLLDIGGVSLGFAIVLVISALCLAIAQLSPKKEIPEKESN